MFGASVSLNSVNMGFGCAMAQYSLPRCLTEPPSKECLSPPPKLRARKRSRESVVLMKDNNKYWAGRICFFLSHTPPGVDVSDESGVYIAHVNCYNHLPQGQNMSATMNCPIFKTSFNDDKGGNMWPVEKLAPCKLGALYHKGRRDHIVILNKFSSFLDCVPD